MRTITSRPNLRTRMQTSLSKSAQPRPADERYPRQGVTRVVRTLLLFCWSVIIWFLGREGIVLLSIVSSHPEDLGDPAKVLPALLIPLPHASDLVTLLVYGGMALSFILLLTACIWATVDVERERRVVHAREISDVLSRSLPAALQDQVSTLLRETGARATPTENEGPPFDEALLPVPDQLVGRNADLEWLLARLRQRHEQGAPSLSVTALGGMGGIGKTTLVAVALRQTHADGSFPDGIAVIPCQQLTDPVEALRRALARFDPQRRRPDATDPAGLAEAARHLLGGKRTLIVLDNVEPALDLRRVIPPLEAADATLLLTARQALPHTVVPLESSRMLELLSTDETLDVFAHATGRATASAFTPVEREAAERIVATLGRHTLAVKLAGAYAADLHRDLTALAQELENPQRAIDLPSGETPHAVALVFAESTDALPPPTLRLFGALAAFASPEFGRNAALAQGAALGLSDPENDLDLLVLRALLRAGADDALPPECDRERLRLHPLLRAFAASELARWSDEDRALAHKALATYYAAYALQAPDSAIAPDEEHISAALEWAHANGEEGLVASLCEGIRYFWRDRWRTDASLRYLPWGIAAAEAQAATTGARDDQLRAANLALSYGQVLRRIGKIDEAERTFETNLVVRRAIEDRRGEGWVLMQLGYISLRRSALADAQARFTQALAFFRATGDRQNEGEALGYLGQTALRRDELDLADEAFADALAIFRDLRDHQSEGWVLTRQGRTARLRGELAHAEEHFQQALTVQRAAHDRQGEGVTLAVLGEVAQAQGKLDDAERYYRAGLARLHEIQDAFHSAGAARDLGAFLVEVRSNRQEGAPLLVEAANGYAAMGLRDAEAEVRATAQRLGCSV